MDYFKKPIVLAIIAVLVIVPVLGAAFFFYFKSQAPKTNTENSQAAQEEVKKLVAEVGKLIELPQGEDPTVATVTDIEKLRDQPFFARAKNGDKVLIYTNAKKAILYDPVAKKVIDVAPINIGSPSATEASARITLRNGTNTVGLTTKIEDLLKKSISGLNVVGKENASKSDFEKTIVVVFNDSFKDTANALVSALKGSSIGSLPSGETKPKDTDILIILGKDRI